MACFDKKYFADKQKECRLRKVYHLNQQMPFETNEEFKKRCSKRQVIFIDNKIVILNAFGKVLDIKDNVKI